MNARLTVMHRRECELCDDMLVDLERPLGAGDQVPLRLTIEGKGGKRTQIDVRATVRPLGQ